MRKNKRDEESFIRMELSILLMGIMMLGGMAMTSSIPHHILVDDDSQIVMGENSLYFNKVGLTSGSILLNNESHIINANDVVSLGGRNSFKLTGNSVKVGDNVYYDGVLAIDQKINHNLFFESASVKVPDNVNKIMVTYGDKKVDFIHIQDDIYQVEYDDSTYKISLDKTVYIAIDDNNVLYKLSETDSKIEITLVGYYKSDTFIVESI